MREAQLSNDSNVLYTSTYFAAPYRAALFIDFFSILF